RLAQRQPAEAAGVDGRLEGPVGVAEARREDGAQLHAVVVAGPDDAVAAFGRDLQRLLDHDVLAGPGGRHRRLEVRPRRRGDDDDVHVLALEDGGEVGVDGGGDADLLHELLGVGPAAADEGDEASTGNFLKGASVKPGDHTAADKGTVQFSLCGRHGTI